MTSNIKIAEKLILDIELMCLRKRKTRTEFFFDLKEMLNSNLTPNQFISNWIEFFNGIIRNFSSIETFLGSIRRAYNYGKNSRNTLIKNFSNELEWSYKKPPLIIHRYIKFVKAKVPKGFRLKLYLLFEFKQNPNTEFAFRNNVAYINNWNSQIKQYILSDLQQLYSYSPKLPNLILFGFSQIHEVYNKSTHYYQLDIKSGAKSKICGTLTTLQIETNNAIDNLNQYFNKISRSLEYFIHNSKIYFTFYYI